MYAEWDILSILPHPKHNKKDVENFFVVKSGKKW